MTTPNQHDERWMEALALAAAMLERAEALRRDADALEREAREMVRNASLDDLAREHLNQRYGLAPPEPPLPACTGIDPETGWRLYERLGARRPTTHHVPGLLVDESP